jgi:hypothetical protein
MERLPAQSNLDRHRQRRAVIGVEDGIVVGERMRMGEHAFRAGLEAEGCTLGHRNPVLRPAPRSEGDRNAVRVGDNHAGFSRAQGNGAPQLQHELQHGKLAVPTR